MATLLDRCDQYSCAIFDCDGVILDANPVKIAAFRAALAGEDPAIVDAFVEEHRRTGGVSRYAKFERFYRELAPAEAPDLAIPAALERFAAASRAGLRECPEVPGVRALLEGFAARRVPVHVVSGGDQDEVREALAARGLDALVSGVHGSPTPKQKHLEALREAGELLPGGVFFGDARLDMELAESFGLEFVFVGGVSDWPEGREVARDRGHLVIEDFTTVVEGP
ncbi:HAD family hydrolase [Pseudenhygromyxa sp. WMMC2535]|uniref:HAD family hydrolase n=1 Tax=Pseudenhygromyxa sp. WMMC2535 TaxID=2712867 RepID=UPI001556D542|nr:HAD family hydrolase [Pseudenhygromyxa sp. WMMC2535]NVB41307.1 HAD family hydrolase [Pseudenhygromyxa sp. WMMC2535]